MRFGVNFFPVFDPAERSAVDYYDRSLDLIELAEELGFEHAQTVEHYCSPYGGYSPDPVTFLTAAAARTTRIRLTTGAVVATFGHPISMAARLAMLDNLSHGRLDVGFGRGFLPAEFAAFEVPMDTSRARFVETVEACRRLWTERDVTLDGRFHRFGPVTLLPRPYQSPHPPIFVAATTSPQSAAAAATAGYHLQVVPSVVATEQLTEILSAYRRAWCSAGHQPGMHRIQIKYSCYVHRDRDVALQRAALHEQSYVEQMARAVAPLAGANNADYPGYEKLVEKAAGYRFVEALGANKVFAGDPVDVRAQMEAVRDAFGADLSVSLQFSAGLTVPDEAAESMRLFAGEVMPAFTDESVPS